MNLQRLLRSLAMLAALFVGSYVPWAQAGTPIVLNFAGLDGNNYEEPLNYYNGGLGGLGSGPGPNYGIVFGSDALSCSGQPGGTCNTALIPGGPGANALFFLTGPGDIMNVAGGFDTGFSFYYSAPFYTGVVDVWSGLDGTGTLLATITLPLTTDGSGTGSCSGTNYCPYVPIGVAFSGVAQSAVFTGTANYIAFADITLGSQVAGVPEPGTDVLFALGIVGAGGLSLIRRRRQSRI
ncbi:MAG: PEP-CTERM sorting domain-containing protein [Proteobacteria bacterium]|nr:PEP-CTERM sorting domain-containing protein [Pseudomonadota bacterium]